jgi:activator of HSP90 ATPase
MLNIFCRGDQMPDVETRHLEGKAMRNCEALVARRPNRRQAISGMAAALGSLVAAPVLLAKPQQTMTETPSTGVEALLTYLHQEVDFKAAPQRIYDALLDSKQFTAFSGAPAEISREVGGAFSLFGGLIVGRNVELIPNKLIVQAWRPSNWNLGQYSLVRIELKEHAGQTQLILDHTGFSEGDFRHLNAGWHEHYWEPLKRFLA